MNIVDKNWVNSSFRRRHCLFLLSLWFHGFFITFLNFPEFFTKDAFSAIFVYTFSFTLQHWSKIKKSWKTNYCDLTEKFQLLEFDNFSRENSLVKTNIVIWRKKIEHLEKEQKFLPSGRHIWPCWQTRRFPKTELSSTYTKSTFIIENSYLTSKLRK